MKRKLLNVKSKRSISRLYFLVATYVCLFLSIPTVNAQDWTIGTIQIGSGTSTINGASGFPITNYSYNYSQQIVNGQEYTMGLGVPGPITKIRYYVTSIGTPSVWNEWTLYLGNTTKTQFESDTDWVPLSQLTQVFSGTISATADSWIEITLDQPFEYTGGNLIVAVDENTAGWNSAPTFRSYTSTPNSGIIYRTDTASENPDPANPPTATSRTANLPQIQFEGAITDCAPMVGISHTNISSSEVVFEFEEALESSYQYAISTQNTVPTNDILSLSAGETSLSVSDLGSNTTYYFWYRRNCESGASPWMNYTFTTICGAFAIPYSDNFDSYSASNTSIPDCWFTPVTYSGYPKIVAASPSSTPNSLRFNSSTTTPTYAVSPQLSAEITSLRVKFSLKREGTSSGTIVVGVMSDPNDIDTFVPVSTISPADNLYHNYTVNLVSSTVTGVNRHVAFKHIANSNVYYYWLDNLIIEEIPGCLMPESIQVSNVLKNDVIISWNHPEILPEVGYEYEIRVSGEAGSGPGGLIQSGNVANTTNTLEITDLQPSTTYQVYVRSVCSSDNLSIWTTAVNFTTLCEYPDVVVNDVTPICGIGTTQISVMTNGMIQWFENINGPQIATGNTFTTPELDDNTTYYFRSVVEADNITTQVGFGTSTSASGGYSPFAGSYGGYKTQYIYTAEELLAAGVIAGTINSVGFDVSATTSANREGFNIHIGTTESSTATSTHIAGLDLVYTNDSQPLTEGINTFVLDTPFVWDGNSNIVIQVSWSNNASSATGGNVRYHSAGASRTTYTYADNRTPAQLLATMTGAVVNDAGATSGGTTTTTYRANTYFNGAGLCKSPFNEVEIVVNPATELVLSTNSIENVCQGNDSPIITITEGAEAYDTYIWEPSTGVYGNAQDGFYFNVHENTTYVLKALHSVTHCRYDQEVTVNVVSMGYAPLEEQIISCGNELIELDVTTNNSVETMFAEQNLQIYSFDTTDNSEWVHNNLTGTTSVSIMNGLDSEENGYVRFSHNTNSTGNITFSQTFNAENTKGLLVELKHMAIIEGNTYDYGTVEYSLDNGETWSVFNLSQYGGQAAGLEDPAYKRFGRQSYPEWNAYSSSTTPSTPSWKTEKFVLLNDETIDLSQVKFRLSLRSDGSVNYYGWLIDTFKVGIVGENTYIWNSELPLYLDQDATQPYNGESVSTVFVYSLGAAHSPVSVTVTNGACTSTDIVDIYVPEIVIPDFSSEQYCQSISVDEMNFEKASGHTYQWYNSSYSQIELESIDVTGTYYVRITHDGCSSDLIAVPIFIVGNASLEVVALQKFCDAATVADLVAVGSHEDAQILWYDTLESSTPLDSNTTLTHNATYYVSQNLYGCITERIPVVVQIFETPVMLETTQLYVCANTLVGNVTIDGHSNLKWYTTSQGGTPLAANFVLTSGIYYIATHNDLCESERLAVHIDVVDYLPPININIIDICGTGIVDDLTQYLPNVVEGAQVKWYLSSTANTPLEASYVLTSGTYYVEQAIQECASPRKAVAVRVTSQVAPVINSQVICQATQIGDISLPGVTGVTYNWYISPTSSAPLSSDYVFSTGYYYVKRVQFGCESHAAQVFMDVRPLPASPIVNPIQSFEQGSVVADLSAETLNVVWYITEEDALHNINALEPQTPLLDGQIYFGVVYNENGCPSLPSQVRVSLYLGLDELDMASLKIYPNPTYDFINISYKEMIDSVEIYNMLGQRVLYKNIEDTDTKIDLQSLSSGTYMVKITVGKVDQLVKIIKN